MVVEEPRCSLKIRGFSLWQKIGSESAVLTVEGDMALALEYYCSTSADSCSKGGLPLSHRPCQHWQPFMPLPNCTRQLSRKRWKCCRMELICSIWLWILTPVVTQDRPKQKWNLNRNQHVACCCICQPTSDSCHHLVSTVDASASHIVVHNVHPAGLLLEAMKLLNSQGYDSTVNSTCYCVHTYWVLPHFMHHPCAGAVYSSAQKGWFMMESCWTYPVSSIPLVLMM